MRTGAQTLLFESRPVILSHAAIGGKNWRWRVRAEALNPTVSSMLGEITKTYMRG